MNSAQPVGLAGSAYALGGGLWFLLAVAGTAVHGIDPPSGSTLFYTSEAIFLLVQLLLFGGFFGVSWSNGVGRGLFGQIAFWLALFGHGVFVAAEAHSLMLGALSPLLPLGALSSAIGLLLTGIAVLRAGQWQGWTRWAPLLVGLYPLVVMLWWTPLSRH
jgi:hypothetical protein